MIIKYSPFRDCMSLLRFVRPPHSVPVFCFQTSKNTALGSKPCLREDGNKPLYNKPLLGLHPPLEIKIKCPDLRIFRDSNLSQWLVTNNNSFHNKSLLEHSADETSSLMVEDHYLKGSKRNVENKNYVIQCILVHVLNLICFENKRKSVVIVRFRNFNIISSHYSIVYLCRDYN